MSFCAQETNGRMCLGGEDVTSREDVSRRAEEAYARNAAKAVSLCDLGNGGPESVQRNPSSHHSGSQRYSHSGGNNLCRAGSASAAHDIARLPQQLPGGALLPAKRCPYA